jgi:ferric-dicitrate binding protein FerR (iron transport regulator)
VLAELSARVVSLGELYTALAAVDAEPPPPPPPSPRRDARRRIRAVAAALLVALIGVAASLAVYWRVTAGESQPYAPPVARGE